MILRRGFSLIELIAALIIAATLAAFSIQYLRQPSQSGKQRSCDVTREILQDYADRFIEGNNRPPSRDLRELAVTEYAGATVPRCPVTDDAFEIDRNNVVQCPTHEVSREK